MKETHIKCDRCGQEFTPVSNFLNVRFRGSYPSGLVLRAIVPFIGEYIETTKTEDVDLCQPCRREFQQWWSNVEPS